MGLSMEGIMTPQVTFSCRCPIHHGLYLPGRACPLCLAEQQTGESCKPLRGERLEDHEGRHVAIVAAKAE